MRIDAKQPLAALRPVRKREQILPHPAREPDRLAQWLGAVVARNRYGEHLQVRQWYSAPEPFGAGPDALAPTARALRLLLPRTPEQNAAAHQRLADPAEWLFLGDGFCHFAGLRRLACSGVEDKDRGDGSNNWMVWFHGSGGG